MKRAFAARLVALTVAGCAAIAFSAFPTLVWAAKPGAETTGGFVGLTQQVSPGLLPIERIKACQTAFGPGARVATVSEIFSNLDPFTLSASSADKRSFDSNLWR
jgi:hypothetical protein